MMRIVVSDIDGTLLSNSRKVSQVDINTLHFLKENDILRILATGRSLYSVSKVLPEDFPIDFLIFSSGAGIINWESKEIIHRNHLEQNQIQFIIEKFLSFDVDFMIHEPIPHNHLFHYYWSGKHGETDFTERLKIYQPHGTPYIPGVDFPCGATQLIAIIPNNLALFNDISKLLTDFKVIRTTSPIDGVSIWIEIFPKHVSKAYGINWLCKILNISNEHMLVIGNDYNDLDMLELTTNSYVVENAPFDLRVNFKVVPSNEESGFTHAVYRWLGAN